MTVVPMHVRGATYLWLLTACVDRWLLNLQDVHDYSPFPKTLVADQREDGSLQGCLKRRKRGEHVCPAVRLASVFLDVALEAGSVGFVNAADLRALRSNQRWFQNAMVFETIAKIGDAGGIHSVERMPVALAVAEVLDGEDQAAGEPQRRRPAKRQRRPGGARAQPNQQQEVAAAAAGPADGAEQPAATTSGLTMVPWEVNSNSVSYVVRGGFHQAIPAFKLRLPIADWKDCEFKTQVWTVNGNAAQQS